MNTTRLDNFQAIMREIKTADMEYCETVRHYAQHGNLDLSPEETQEVLAAIRDRIKYLRGCAIGVSRAIGILTVAITLAASTLLAASTAKQPSGQVISAGGRCNLTAGSQPVRPSAINVEKLADCVFLAEGGANTRYPYGVKSIPCKDAAEARRITINSINNNLKRWTKAGCPGSFIEFMADRWCPKSADAQGNINWKRNVKRLYEQSI